MGKFCILNAIESYIKRKSDLETQIRIHLSVNDCWELFLGRSCRKTKISKENNKENMSWDGNIKVRESETKARYFYDLQTKGEHGIEMCQNCPLLLRNCHVWLWKKCSTKVNRKTLAFLLSSEPNTVPGTHSFVKICCWMHTCKLEHPVFLQICW